MEAVDTKTWSQGLAASLGAHLVAILAIALLAWLKARSTPASMELDMAQTLVPPVQSAAPQHSAPHKDWVQAKKGSLAQPQSETETAESEAALSCPPPCPSTPGAYAPGGLAVTPPVMIDAIDPEDYPKVAAKQGLQGRVVAELFIDEQGLVRKVQLLQKGEDVFNAWVLEKMQGRRFHPARDAQGKPMAVTYRQSFKFTLND